MKKNFIVLLLMSISLQVSAIDLILDKSSANIDIGDISAIANGDVIETLNIIQNSHTPKKVSLNITYKKPISICTEEEDYIATPECKDEGSMPPTYQNCDSYIATRCISYELSTDPDDIHSFTARYIIKFKNKKNTTRSFQINLKKKVKIKNGSNIFDKPSDEQIMIASDISKGDFQKLIVRPEALLRAHTKIILR